MAGLNYVAFNQDHSQLAVATTRGLRIYTTDPFELTTHSYEDDIALIEQLFSTSLVAMILTPRLLRIVNTRKHSTICELSFHGMVVAVKMNRKRLVVMLEEIVFIYDISNMKLLHQQTTPLNPTGICALSPNSENNYLVLPHYQRQASNATTAQSGSNLPKSVIKEPISGDVLLYDLNKMEEVTVIQAHQTQLSYLAVNYDGTLLATASEKGTVIRIFSIPSGKKLYQFRRGSMPARIYCMSFNATSTLLCVSSATETVHIFKLAPPGSNPSRGSRGSRGSDSAVTDSNASSHYTPQSPTSPPLSPTFSSSSTAFPDTSDSADEPTPAPPNRTLLSLIRRTSQAASTSLVQQAASYLPASVTEIWEPQRDFAWARVPRGSGGVPVRSVVAMARHKSDVMVATGEGGFYVWRLDLEKGGEGVMVGRWDDINGLKHRKGLDGEE